MPHQLPTRAVLLNKLFNLRETTHSSTSRSRSMNIMAKILKCGDLMPGCNAVIEGKDDAEVMARGAEPSKKAHGMATIPPDLAKKVQAAIKDKK